MIIKALENSYGNSWDFGKATTELRHSSNSIHDYLTQDLGISDELLKRSRDFIPDECILVNIS